jgi:ectoine hydroxylase-related dioxygenase (phytanoyl-CoA dioxygenase family)
MNSERFHELESFCSKRAEYFSVEKMVNEYIKIYNKD